MSIETLGSRDVERFLSSFHAIPADQLSAYAGRLKHISRQGFPSGVGTGRGTPARYDADQFFQMLAVTELTRFGVLPARAIKLASEAWPRLRKTVLTVWKTIEAAQQGRLVLTPPIFWSVPTQVQLYPQKPDLPYSPDASDVMHVMTADEVSAVIVEGGKNARSHAFIAAHQLIADAFEEIKFGHLSWPPDRIAKFMLSMIPT